MIQYGLPKIPDFESFYFIMLFALGTTPLYVDELNPITDINGNVPKPGLYVLVAQYYQPDKPSKCILLYWLLSKGNHSTNFLL